MISDWIKNGEEVIITYGRKKKGVAVMININKFKKPGKRKLGILEGKASAKFKKDFKITSEEFLGE